jgi:hypothetical protein
MPLVLLEVLEVLEVMSAQGHFFRARRNLGSFVFEGIVVFAMPMKLLRPRALSLVAGLLATLWG